MLNTLKKLLFTCMCIFSFSVYANSSFSQATINGIIVHDYGTVLLIVFNSPPVNSESCSGNDFFVLYKAHPSFKEMYAAIMLAYSTQSKVTGWVNGCDATFSRPVLTRLDMYRP